MTHGWRADQLTSAKDTPLALADNVLLADSALTEITKTVNPADSVTLADAIAFSRDVALSDAVSAVDAAVFDRIVALADVLALTDEISRQLGLSMADTLALADLADPQNVPSSTPHSVTVDDAISVADALSIARNLLKSDSVTVFDAHQRHKNGILLSDGSVAIVKQGIIYIGRF